MPATPTNQKMGELHEIHLAEVFGATKTKSSGNQWSDPMDAKNHADLPWPFRVDGKSTKAKQIGVTLDMIAKAREQAGTRHPALGLRWYGNETLTSVLEEWSAVPDDVMAGLLADARETASLREQLRQAQEHERVSGEHIAALRKERDELKNALEAVQQAWMSAEDDVETLTRTPVPQAASGPLEAARQVPGYVPQLPWTVVISVPDEAGPPRRKITGIRYDEAGHQHEFAAGQVRVERSVSNRPRLIVDDLRIENGDLYVDGVLRARAWADRRDQETG